MEFKIVNTSFDKVLNSYLYTVVTDYEFALKFFIPIIDKLDFQRTAQKKSFYYRLEKDIIKGCIMPNLTIAIKKNIEFDSNFDIKPDLLAGNAFVLDGIQRLDTLKRASSDKEFDELRPLFVNVIVCSSMDKLLYRMVTLNNGQKPMTARHQIEILASNLLEYEELPIIVFSEKEVKTGKNKDKEDYFNKETIIKGYIAYISNSINIDNQKIIESKMDELITSQIMDSDLPSRNSEYFDILKFISNCISNPSLKAWFTVNNNFIGFSASMSLNFKTIENISIEDFSKVISTFEEAFSALDKSKIKIGIARRKSVKYFFDNYLKFFELDSNDLLDKISMEI